MNNNVFHFAPFKQSELKPEGFWKYFNIILIFPGATFAVFSGFSASNQTRVMK